MIPSITESKKARDKTIWATTRPKRDCGISTDVVAAHEMETFGMPSFLLAAAAKSLQLCPTLCYPIDGSPLGSSVPGILQARTLERVAISFFNA